MPGETTSRGPGSEKDQARFYAKAGLPFRDGCMPWLGATDGDGYGQLSLNGRLAKAARYSYELAYGPMPEGLVPDHLCRMRQCVRPDHLEAVTGAENTRRGASPAGINTRKTHCPQGHRYSVENTYIDPAGRRRCRTCRKGSHHRKG